MFMGWEYSKSVEKLKTRNGCQLHGMATNEQSCDLRVNVNIARNIDRVISGSTYPRLLLTVDILD